MTTDDPAVSTEPTPVQLTRMEGILTLVAYKVDTLVNTVGEHTKDIAGLNLIVARLDQDAAADKRTVEQTAKALREAKEAADATARAETAKSERQWTPMNRLYASITAASAILAVYFAARGH
jgi:hypothetical protein